MKDKKLYSTAIIPDELYVTRDADRKLKEVILRMSKPAYISVARQMGKTNLLIQTKRSLENESSRYVYIDITNNFESAQACFRYIVNQILNSNEDIKEFQEASDHILKSRQSSSTNPTEEYQNEIREILKRFKGNLIVFLDEVDDLRKHSFSDDIFGQIRKTYFINETYPVLKRITYVLSGVIDPEKLIKTKDNSPFNIAIPIYLEDFKYDEFLELINKSELILENEIKEYIYDWLKGNPRMSFEILSIIEDEYINGNQITKNLVDKIIIDFYLTNFKNPPIDHIRDLIKHNTEVRKALIKLKSGQIDELTDDVINKFYLFGITSTKINKQNLTIKNRVIELSLSDEWIQNIELEKQGYYHYGTEKIAQGQFEEGIKLLNEYLQNEPKGSFATLAKFGIGQAFYKIGNHELSNQYLLEKPITKESSSDLYFRQVSYIGVNFMKLGKFEIASEYFDEIIKDAQQIPQMVINAYVNKCELLINLDKKYKLSDIEPLYSIALDFINRNEEKIEEKQKFISIIYFRLGYLYNRDNLSKHEALQYYEKALLYSDIKEKPLIYLLIDSCLESDSERRIDVYIEIAKLIIKNDIIFSESVEIVTPFNELQLNVILSNLIEFKLISEFDSLLRYSLLNIYSNRLKEFELIYQIAIFSINTKNWIASEFLFSKVLEFKDIDLKIQKHCHQIIGILESNRNNVSASFSHLIKFVKLFDDNNNFNEQLQIIDFTAFISVIDFYRKNKNFEKSFEVASIIEKQFNGNLNSENKANSVVILFYIMDYYSFIGDIHNSTIYGKRVLSLISEVKPILNELSYVDKKGLGNIEMQTRSMLYSFKEVKPIEPIRIRRELGRNEYVKVRYKNGTIISIKYKKVIDDIARGECYLLNK